MSVRLPKSANVVLARLARDGPLTPKELSSRVDLAPRTVTLALKKLMDVQLCRKVSNFEDMRQSYYCVDMDRVRELRLGFTIDSYIRLHPSFGPSDHSSRSFRQ